MKRLLALFLLCAPSAWAQITRTAATCNTSDVQAQVNASSTGDTVIIPAGTCTWTSGVSISGKGINIQGAGSGRIVAYSTNTLALTAGSTALTIAATNVAGTMPTLNIGQTIRIIELGVLANFLQGTVTSYNSSTGALVVNATSVGGTCGIGGGGQGLVSNCKRWMISTSPSISETKLINNVASNNQMFTITEDTSFHTSISGIHFATGSTNGSNFSLIRNGSSGQAVLIHDNMLEFSFPEIIDLHTNRGVIWNNSFVGNPFTGSGGGVRIQDNGGNLAYSWITGDTMGTADTTGQNNVYIETNDFEAVGQTTDFDSNSRAVWRYNFLNNSFGSSHGADTSPYGLRHFEFYNNKGRWDNLGCDASTVNPGNGWMLIRGGTFAWHDNTLDSLVGCAWGTKPDLKLIIENLQRNAGPDPCWGANFSSPGQFYHAPRQIGFGRITGTGTVTYPPLGLNNATNDSVTYVGDIDPAYVWNNNRTLSVTDNDFGAGGGCAGTLDSTTNYIISGRDYFNNGTAKPSYTPFTYPHPLTGGSSSPVISFSPNPAVFPNQNVGITSAPITITVTNTGTASQVMATPYFTITGPDASNFANTGTGTCTNGATVAVSASCTVKVTFTPSPTGLRSATLTILGTASASVSLSGTGTSPVLSIAPNPVAFGNQTVSTTSAPKTVTTTNTGTGNEVLSTPHYTNSNPTEFLRVGGSCADAASIPPGSNCTDIFSFKPSALGGRSGTFTIIGTINGSVPMTGTGITATQPVVQLGPRTVNFGTVNTGNSSLPTTFTLQNTGTATLNITSISTSDAVQFPISTQLCGATLAPSASCTFADSCQPSTAASLNATLTVSTNASSSPDLITLSCTGTTPPINPPPAPAPVIFIGSTLPAQPIISSVGLTAPCPMNNRCTYVMSCTQCSALTQLYIDNVLTAQNYFNGTMTYTIKLVAGTHSYLAVNLQ